MAAYPVALILFILLPMDENLGYVYLGVTVSNVVMNVIYKLLSRQCFISFGYKCADIVAGFIWLFYIQPLKSFQTICQRGLTSVSSSSVWGL